MPITKSAKKALRQDQRKAANNQLIRQRLKKVIAKTKRNKSAKDLSEVYRMLDRAVKKGVIHKNKAARMKSRFIQITPKTVKPKKGETK